MAYAQSSFVFLPLFRTLFLRPCAGGERCVKCWSSALTDGRLRSIEREGVVLDHLTVESCILSSEGCFV